jgi:hypothetical protein
MQFDLMQVFGAAPASVRLRFVASDRGNGSLVEAAVDDVSLRVRYATDALILQRTPSLVAFPNPCNPATEVRFTTSAPGRAELAIYDARGARVRSLLAASLVAGPHAIRWDGRDASGAVVASGIYIARLSTADGVATRKLTVLR